MNLNLLRGRWWPIVCPPSGAFLNCQKGCIYGEVCTQLTELTYPQWYLLIIRGMLNYSRYQWFTIYTVLRYQPSIALLLRVRKKWVD